MERPLSFALAKAGNNKDARMAIIAITTNSSISVNADTLEINTFGFIDRIKKLWL